MAMRKASTLVLRAAELRNPEIQARVQAEMQHAGKQLLRSGIRTAMWMSQPYRRGFVDSRGTIKRTDVALKKAIETATDLRGKPMELFHFANGTRIRAWRVYSRNPVTFCGLLIGGYTGVSMMTASTQSYGMSEVAGPWNV